MAEAVVAPNGCGSGGGAGGGAEGKATEAQQGQVLALVLAALRKSVVLPCQMADDADDAAAGSAWGMEIGWPTDVRHVAHVTFDRLHGFLGLPVEFELEIPGQVPSASASVFGVSPESMQCCYDDKGNSVPKILLLMQERLYAQGGLKAEGIFRITPENSQEEHVREQLNSGLVPHDIDVHCLASLIKAWFRELPEGMLDSLSAEQVLHCNTEEQCIDLVKLLPATQAALLNWVVELMADVVEEEESNKMNARNVAMVFAPNMTQMSDPLTALMHAVQVMNLLKTLILITLRKREDDDAGAYSSFSSSSSISDGLDEEDGHDQQHDDNDTDTENYNDDDSRSTTSIDEQAKQLGNDRLIGVSRRYTSIGYSSEDEDTSLNYIEECFLKRLEWKAEMGCAEADDSRSFRFINKAEPLGSFENIKEVCNAIEDESDMTRTINELRPMETIIEMLGPVVGTANEGELILCS